MPGFVLVFGLIVIILIVTTLASRLVEGSPLSFPLIFLGFGFVLGSGGVVRLRARVSWKAHTSISWCGLRGLNSLLLALLRGPTPPIVLDVRSRSSYDSDGAQIPHSVQVLPITSPSGPPTNPSTGWWSLTAPEATRQPAPVRRNT